VRRHKDLATGATGDRLYPTVPLVSREEITKRYGKWSSRRWL